MRYNFLTPKAQARPSGDKGWGSFAIQPIEPGEILACFGGELVTYRELIKYDPERRSRAIQIEEDAFLLTGEFREPGDSINHSCNPNGGMRNAVQVVAMRRIEIGEELTFDYAMADGSDYDEFECQCGAPACRGTISGDDWKIPDLQERYKGFFSPYIERRISLAATSRRTRVTKSLATFSFIALLLIGAFWGQDDHFPFGPFRMYATTQSLNGQSSWYSIYGLTNDGEKVFLTSNSYGLRRAEIEGQTNRLRENSDLLCLIGTVAQENRSYIPDLKSVVLVREARQLVDGKPVGDTMSEVKAQCDY